MKLRSWYRLGEGQLRVRKVRVRSESCVLKDLNIIINKDVSSLAGCDPATNRN